LGSVRGTPVEIFTSHSELGQEFYLEGYVNEGIPQIFRGMFKKYIPIHELPRTVSLEFLLESFSNLDSLDLYPGLVDSSGSNLETLFNQRCPVDLSRAGNWVSFEFTTAGCEYKTIDGIKFNIQLYAPEGVLTSCRMLMRNLIGVNGDGSFFAIDPEIMTVVDDKTQTIGGFALGQNYPNPFNPSTTISYQLPQESLVTLKVYDVLGNEMVTLINEEKPAGSYEAKFDASKLSSGVYVYRLQAGNFIQTKKMMLVK
jgi:hypothetical protein